MLDQLKKDAELAASEYDIDWELIDNPNNHEYLRLSLGYGSRMIPQLEKILTKLQRGESILLPNQESPLPFEELERYREFISNELYQAYILDAIKTKMELIESIINQSALDI
jgi:hypothetical protein